jgi:hypothetical protein
VLTVNDNSFSGDDSLFLSLVFSVSFLVLLETNSIADTDKAPQTRDFTGAGNSSRPNFNYMALIIRDPIYQAQT